MEGSDSQDVSPSKVDNLCVGTMGSGVRSSASDDSEGNEKIEIIRPSTPQEEAQMLVEEASPTRESKPSGPEKKPSEQQIGGKESGEGPDADNENSNRSFGLDWPMDQNGHQRDWFREVLDSINQFRFNCGMLVNNGHVQFFIVILICINAIMMGIGTFDFVKDNPKVDNAFETVDLIFLIIFTIELGLQFIYHGWRLILDGWLVFDLIIIVTSWSFSSVQIIRAFRIFRALRLVTRIKIMKNLILGELLFP